MTRASLLQRPTAKAVTDSVTPDGARIITFLTGLWAPVTPEILRHRAFSFSWASMRAIPFLKVLEKVRERPAGPNFWGAKNKGMEPGRENAEMVEPLELLWIEDAERAAIAAKRFERLGLHKSIPNRVLYPYIQMHGLVTATDRDNYYALRTHPTADPLMHELSWRMWDVQKASTPVQRTIHAPFATQEELAAGFTPTLVHATAMRCARLSYNKLDGNPSSLELDAADGAEKLAAPFHMSPYEHVATAGESATTRDANFLGWKHGRSTFFGAGTKTWDPDAAEAYRTFFDVDGYLDATISHQAGA